MRAKRFIKLPLLCALTSGATSLIPPLVTAQPLDLAGLPDLSLEELMNLEITSVSKRPETLLQSPSAIQVITRDQIRRSGSTTIPEALRLATNLNVAQQNALEWIISARGFSSDVGNKLLVMIDGRSVYTPLFSGVFWDRQDYLLEDIERIEVISGPGGTVWGANAVNGVINIITRSADQSQGLYFETATGNELKQLFGIRYGAKINQQTSYRAYLKWFEMDAGFLSDGSEGRDDWRKGQAGFRIDSQANERDSFTLQGDYYRNSELLDQARQAEVEGGNILARWSRTFSERSDATLQAYLDYTDLKLPTPAFQINGTTLAPEGLFRDRLTTFDIDFSHRYALGQRHKLVWGLNYRYTDDQVDNAPSIAFYPENLRQELLSGFIQDEISLIAETLSLTLGSKLEHNDYTGYEWEPGVRLQWNLNPEHMVWAAISHTVRMPSRIDRDISQTAREYFVILQGGEDFKSETVDAYELGYRVQLSDKLLGSVSAFFNQYDDIRSTSMTPGTILPFFFENNIAGDTYGVELNLSYQAKDWWQLSAGYNYLQEDLEVKSGTFDFNNALNETADPKHQISIRSSMEFQPGIEFDLAWRWVDQLPTNNAGNLVFVPSYAELDMRLAWHLNDRVELSLIGKNLLHKHHQEFGNPGPTQEEAARNIHAKLRLHF